MTKEYELALNAVREATANFEVIRNAYRAGRIGDDEFLKAQLAYRKAEKRFDVAFAKEEKENNENDR